MSEEESLVETSSALHGTEEQKHFASSDSSKPTAADQLVPDGGNSSSQLSPVGAVSQELDFDALRAAITRFKAAKASRDWTSQGSLNLNTHQSFLGVGLPPPPCLNTFRSDDSSTSSLALNIRQISDNQVDSSLQLNSTHRSLSQEDLRRSQVQETTISTSSSDSTAPTSSSHTDMNCKDSSSRLGSAMVLQTPSDDLECLGTRGQDLTKMPTVSSKPNDHMLTLTLGISNTAFERGIQMSETNSSSHDYLNGSSGTVPYPSSIENAENAPTPNTTSVPTTSESTVSTTAHKPELVEPPVPSLHSIQDETPSIHGGSALPASFSKDSATGSQTSGVWSGPQGPIATSSLGPGLNSTAADPMAAMMIQHVMGNTFGSSLGGVVPQGGLLPMTNMPIGPMAWNGYPRGSAPVVWGMQQSLQLRQMQQTQFFQGFTWRADFPGQGNGYRPFGGGL